MSRRGVGVARAVGLVAASLCLMGGVVFAANPARYGGVGLAAGAALIGLGAGGAVRLFRSAGDPADGSSSTTRKNMET